MGNPQHSRVGTNITKNHAKVNFMHPFVVFHPIHLLKNTLQYSFYKKKQFKITHISIIKKILVVSFFVLFNNLMKINFLLCFTFDLFTQAQKSLFCCNLHIFPEFFHNLKMVILQACFLYVSTLRRISFKVLLNFGNNSVFYNKALVL